MALAQAVKETDAEFGERVHTIMWRQRVTQTELARRVGMSQTALSRSLHGVRNWRIAEVLAIVEELGVQPGELLPRLDSNQQPVGLQMSTPPTGVYGALMSAA